MRMQRFQACMSLIPGKHHVRKQLPLFSLCLIPKNLVSTILELYEQSLHSWAKFTVRKHM